MFNIGKLASDNQSIGVNVRNLSTISNRLKTKLSQTTSTSSQLHSAKTHQRLTDCARNIVSIIEAIKGTDLEESNREEPTPIEEFVSRSYHRMFICSIYRYSLNLIIRLSLNRFIAWKNVTKMLIAKIKCSAQFMNFCQTKLFKEVSQRVFG